MCPTAWIGTNNRGIMKYFTAFLGILLLFISGCTTQDTSKDNFNIVLITIDTLRADHLSCYGYERKTSPNIDKIAERGIVFKNVIAPSSWTAPSMVSLFTSVYPINHGVVHGLGTEKIEHMQEVFSDKLVTLTEILKAHGYTTFGVASNLHLSEKLGFARGFNYFKCLPFLPAPPVNKTVYSWEDAIKNSDKFFLWVHYFDPHHPYSSNEPWIEHYASKESTQKLNLSKKSWSELLGLIPAFKKNPQTVSNLIALYDSEINFVDSYIGELIQKFELDKDTLIIISADHGEGFLEHGHLGHGGDLCQGTLHIPLIVKMPHSSKKETFEKHVNLIDIMPTILHILNIDPPEQILGEFFWEKKGILFWLKKFLLNEDTSFYDFAELDTTFTLKTILTPDWKYIYNYEEKTEELYKIRSDPLELNNLADKETKQRNQLKDQLFKWASTAKKYPTVKKRYKLSQEEKEKLETLGYITTQ
ncbi:MAG: sulfatase [Candidatus Hodarchaeales archaeon]|jgi:arylsulfatase A-like enzyme